MKIRKVRISLFCLIVFVFSISSALSANSITIYLDPPDRLSGATVLGEWNTSGNLKTWTGTNISGLQATGGHWESHANYLRQAWQLHYAERFPIDQQCQLDLQIYELSNLRQDHGRLIYRDFRIHQALQDYADDMGLNYNVVAQLWFEGTSEMTVYDKLATFLPAGYKVEDVGAFGLRHWPFLDFAVFTQCY